MNYSSIISSELLDEVNIAEICYQLASESYQYGSPWSQMQFEQDLALVHSYYDFFYAAGKCIGFISSYQVIDEVEIGHVVIAKAFQNKGYGHKFLKEWLSDIFQKGYQKIFLEVRESNLAAQKLYQSLGFVMINRRKNYYQNPVESGLIMMQTKE